MDMKVVLFVSSAVAFTACGVALRRAPLLRPTLSAAMWVFAGIAVMQVPPLMGVSEGLPLYMVQVGGLVSLLVGASKLIGSKLSRSPGESQVR